MSGVSGYQRHFSSREIFTPGDEVDTLVAMNPAALKTNLADLKRGGTLIVNEDAFDKSNNAKAGYKKSPLDDGDLLAGYRVHRVPMTRLTRDSVEGLDGLPQAWMRAADDEQFRAVQHGVVDDEYYLPAVARWCGLGLATPLSLAALYDTIIQHGEGEDPDGLPAIIDRAVDRSGGTPADGLDESKWLSNFLDERRKTLVPAASAWSVAELADAIRVYQSAAGGRVTVAWVVLSGINTGADEVEALRELFAGLPLRINLIDVNDARPDGYRRAPSEELSRFRDQLASLNVPIVRRYSGGAARHAACGMLANATALPPGC